MFLDQKKIFFVAMCILTIVLLMMVKNKKRLMLFMLVSLFPFAIGFIIYGFWFNGIMLSDFPLVLLLLYLIFDNKSLYFPKEGIFISLLLLWAVVGSRQAQMPGWAISETIRHLRGFLVFLVIINGVRTQKDLQIVLTALMLGLLFQCLLSTYQWRFGALGLRFLGESSYISWRTKGTFQHESYFGNYLATLVPMVFRMFVFYRPTAAKLVKEHMQKYGVLLFLGILALFTSMTRGPWVGFIIAIGIMIIYSLAKRKLRPKILAPLAIVIIAGSAFLIRYLPNIMSQFGEDRMESANIRMPLNLVALEVIKQNPLFGVGMANYTSNCAKYVKPERFPYLPEYHINQLTWDVVHNSFLLVTAESGILGGVMFFLFFIAVLLKVIKLSKEIVDPFLLNLTIAVGTGLLAMFIAFQFSPDIRIHQINILFYLMASLIFVIEKINFIQIKQSKFNAMKIRKETKIYENFRHI